MSGGVLRRILDAKREEVLRMRPIPAHPPMGTPQRVLDAMSRGTGASMRLIAEIKPRSPSAGVLSSVLSPEDRAQSYARAGASMISVLTDEIFFGGSFATLRRIRSSLDASLGESRPLLLCKDFVLDPVQIAEAAASGADAVLLIARILSAGELRTLVGEARRRSLEPLVEVWSPEELNAALGADARMIGVNARDLDTLEVDFKRAGTILAAIPPELVRVHLSGLKRPEDVAAAARAGIDAALIGEALMREDEPGPLLRMMVHSASGRS